MTGKNTIPYMFYAVGLREKGERINITQLRMLAL